MDQEGIGPLRALLAHANRVEKWTLAGLVATTTLVLAFVLLANEVVEGRTHAFDERILLLLRVPGDPMRVLGPPWLKEAMRDITALGGTSVLTIIVAAVLGFLLVLGLRRAALMAAVSVVGGLILSNALKAAFARPRPEFIPHDMVVYTASFPSGHTTLSAVVYLTLGSLLCRTQASTAVKSYILGCAAFLTAVVGISRVYLGVHWPTDVLAGWLVGVAWALLCWFVMLWLQSRGEIEPEQAGGEGFAHGNGRDRIARR
jgi:undecaprenyl-diphosphatase